MKVISLEVSWLMTNYANGYDGVVIPNDKADVVLKLL